MGGRLLKRWLALPSTDKDLISQRHNIVDHFILQEEHRNFVCELLSSLSDIERLVSKIATKKITPRELYNLNESLKTIKPLKNKIKKTSCKDLNK